MNALALMTSPLQGAPFLGFADSAANFFPAGEAVAQTITANPLIIIGGIILIIISIAILLYLKDVLVHAITGGIAWAIAVFIFHVPLPLIPSLVVAIIFGPAGVGAMLLLKAFGIF